GDLSAARRGAARRCGHPPAGAAPARAEPRHGGVRARPAPGAGAAGTRTLRRSAGRRAGRGPRAPDPGADPPWLAQSDCPGPFAVAAGALGGTRRRLAAALLAGARPGPGPPAQPAGEAPRAEPPAKRVGAPGPVGREEVHDG